MFFLSIISLCFGRYTNDMQFIVSQEELCEANTSSAGQMVCEINGFHLTYGTNHDYLEI